MSQKIDIDYEKTKDGLLICPCCEKPMKTVRQRLHQYIVWQWSEKEKKYIKEMADDDADKPCCPNCDCNLDWDIGLYLGY